MKKYKIPLYIILVILSISCFIFHKDILSNIWKFVSNHLDALITFISVSIAALIFREAYLMRIINTQPELVYYLSDLDNVTGLLKNIGKGIAYNIKIIPRNNEVFHFLDQMNFSFPHIAPDQQIMFPLGALNVAGQPLGFDIHKVELSYEDKMNKTYRSEFTINSELIKYVDKDPLHAVSKELKDLSSKIKNKNWRL